MPSPKDGKAGNLVAPAAPRDALEADKADPGEVDQLKVQQQASGTGKYGSTPIKPFKASKDDVARKKTSWIEILLVDEEDSPVPGVRYEVKLPDGTLASGTLNANGLARLDGFEPGTCQVRFPEMDGDAWRDA